MKVVAVHEMQAIDRAATERYGISALTLMEQAGECLAACAQRLLAGGATPRVVVLAGNGKNGGDGLVCARHLAKAGVEVKVLQFLRSGLAPETRKNYKRLKSAKVPLLETRGDFPHAWIQEFLNADLVVDALLGIGLSGSPRAPYTHAINALNATRVPVLAVDVPSGLNPDTGEPSLSTVRAQWTVTFGLPKLGLLENAAVEYVGRLQVEPIRFPPDLIANRGAETIFVDRHDAAEWLPRRSWIAHKRSAGRVLIIGGCGQYHGAPLLAARGARRAGAGYVALAYPAGLDAVMRAHVLEELCFPLGSGAYWQPGSLKPLLALAADFDAVLIGPGMGTHAPTQTLIGRLLQGLQGPRVLVLDADALTALANGRGTAKRKSKSAWILTPHEGEAGKLLKNSAPQIAANRMAAAHELAQRYQAVALLKGRHSLAASPEGALWVVGAGSPALATAGTGDVLSGAIAALAAQKVPPKEAAALGAYVHGLAGDLACRNSLGLGVSAGDVAEQLPAAMERLLRGSAGMF